MKPETSGAVLELLLAEAAPSGQRLEQSGMIVGSLSGFDEAGQPWVALPDPESDRDLPARSIVVLDQGHLGCQVLLAFERNDRRRPIVIGVMQESGSAKPAAPDQKLPGVEADLDGETLVLSAKREIVLRCGKSSITLTRAGKVLIRGAYLLSRSSGVNRIKGGSVQIN
jgi:hypothetical protein